MEQANEAAGAPATVIIERDLTGTFIVGNGNVVIDAECGSIVTVVSEADRPDPKRKGRVELRPRRRHVPPLGADAVIEALSEAVRCGRPAQLWGAPGTGKSTLLRHAAWVIEPGPDGVLFLSATGREIGDLAQEVFEACYETAGYAPSRADLKQLMAEICVTVYVDDADFARDQLRDLMDLAPTATFVFASSEDTLRGEGSIVEVQGLGLADGLALLDQEIGSPLAAEARSAAADLWKTADGRPLMLLRAARLIRSGPSGAIAMPRPEDLLPLLFAQLGEAEVRVLWLLATLHAAPVDPVHLGALAGIPDAAVLCGRLERAGMLLSGEHGYRCAPDVLPLVLKRCPKPFPPDEVCRYFASWAAEPETTPGQLADQALALAQAADLAANAGQPALAVQLARAVSPRLARSLRLGSWGLLLSRGWSAARANGDKQAEAYFTHEEGIRSLLTGQRVMAGILVAEALVLWRELGDIHAIQAAESVARNLPSAPAHPPAHPGAQVPAGHAAAHSAGASHATQVAIPHGASASHLVLQHMATCAHVPVQQFAMVALPHATVPSIISGSHIPLIGKLVAAVTAKGASFVAFVVTVAVVGSTVVVGGIVVLAQHATAQSGLAGTWENSQLGGVTFTQAGSDTYSAASPCPGVNFTLTGSGPAYSGRVPVIPESGGSCTVIGYTVDTWTISSDGQRAVFTRTLPSGEEGPDGGKLTCANCGTYTFTRVP